MYAHLLTAVDARLRYHDLPGPGIPLVFIHGLGCSSACDFPRVAFDPALPARRFILVDLLGSGFSDKPSDFSYSVEEHAQTVLDLLNTLGASQFDLFGHSMGGAIAIVVASLQPDRIRRLVLGEPNLDSGGGTFSRAIAAQSESDYVAYGHASMIQSANATGDYIWAGSMAVSAPFAIHRAAKSLVLGGVRSWRDRLLSLPMPRTIVFGERSLPDPDTTRLADAGLSVRIVPNAGHGMTEDNPSGLAGVIHRALS